MSVQFYSPKNPYYEFSNYYPSLFELDGRKWRTVEQYFQAQKFNIDAPEYIEYFSIIALSDSPQKAKDLGCQRFNQFGAKWKVSKVNPSLGLVSDWIQWSHEKNLKLRSDWEDIKVDVMRRGLAAKFSQNEKLRLLLAATGDAEIIEVNPNDYIWGAGKDGSGQNWLGRLLVELRDKKE